MFTKQILVSASLALVSSGRAHAQPAATAPSEPASPPAEAPHRPTGQFYVGAGFNTDDNFSVAVGVSQSDLFHTGNGLYMDTSLSARYLHSDLKFVHPLDAGTALEADIYNHYDLLPGFTREGAGGTLTLRTQLGDHVSSFIRYRFEHVSTKGGDSVLSRGGDTGGFGDTDIGNIASLATGIEYSTLDHKLAPTRGTALGASFEVADPALGSDYYLAKVNAWASTHQALGPFILHVGGSVAEITSSGSGVDAPYGVPFSERLYFDGSSQIRGYAPGALMPLGGNLAAFGHAELELPVWRTAGLSVHAFGDAGAMVNIFGQAAASSGFGVLWRSPLGPFGVDLAFPLGGKPVWLVNVGGGF